MIQQLIGKTNGPISGLLGAEYVKSALLSDYRVSRVESAAAEISGDSVRVTARAVAVEGGVVDLQLQ